MNTLLPVMLGTLFGVCLVIFALTGAGLVISRGVANAVREMRKAPPAPDAGDAMPALPEPVARYLGLCRAAGRARVKTVRVRHGGKFAPAPGRELAITGFQYFSADPPGFVWWGRIRLAPFVFADARDSSIAGKGRMLVRAAGFLTVGDASGERMDEGALMRLLGEMVWFPTALADPRFVRWAPMDGNAAAATLRVGGVAASLVFRFGPDGLVSSVEGLRWRDVGDGNAVLTPWFGLCADYREVGGMLVPFAMSANWLYEGRMEEYARWVVEAVEYDVPGLW